MWTTNDFLARAAEEAAVGGVESEVAAAATLAQAEGAARWPDDWVAVAGGWIDRGRPDEARRCLGEALERAGGEHWPTRRAAELLLGKLDDRAAARAALGRIAARLSGAGSSDRVYAYQWVLLAEAYREVLGDEAQVRWAMECAAAGAKAAGDLVSLAQGHARLFGDLDAARAALERAEVATRAAGELREMWGIANGWRDAVRDPDRARQTLAAAVAETGDVRDLTAFAKAWRSLFDDDAQVRAALGRAEALAVDAGQWVSLAEAYFDGGSDNRTAAWDAGGVRRALEAARAAAATGVTGDAAAAAEQGAAITAGYRDWLGEAPAGAELPPAAYAPEAVLTAERAIEGWDRGAPRALLELLRARLEVGRLEAIATADYGIAWTKHQRALAEIHTTGLVPMPLPWHPLEALELYRWQRGKGVDHEVRAFACAVLALDAACPGTGQCGHVGNVVAPLVESAWAVGLEEPLEAMLGWLAEVASEGGYAWPLLGLVLSRARRDPDDPRLAQLAAELERADAGEPPSSYVDLWRELAGEGLARAPVDAAYASVVRRVLGVA